MVPIKIALGEPYHKIVKKGDVVAFEIAAALPNTDSMFEFALYTGVGSKDSEKGCNIVGTDYRKDGVYKRGAQSGGGGLGGNLYTRGTIVKVEVLDDVGSFDATARLYTGHQAERMIHSTGQVPVV